MSNNSRWTQEEEMSLIKNISTGVSTELLAQQHERSVSAIELRLKKIIYENAKSGKSLATISKLLNTPLDKVTQYFYSYKEFKEKQSGVKDDIEIKVEPNSNKFESEMQVGGKNNIDAHIEKAFMEPNNLDKIESKLKKLEMENKILKLIVENRDLSHKLDKLIKEGKVDKKNIKNLIKLVRKSN